MKIEKFTEQQRELFGEFGEEGKKKPLRTLGREEKFSLSVSLDALLLFGILLLMVAVLLYSTGVEIGRHRVKRPPAEVVSAPEPPTARVSPSPPTPPKVLVQPPSPAGGYTIQVLSYRETGPAGRSLETFRKQGYSAFLLSGSHGVAICVGTFARASDAQQTLKELRKRYPDCFVRKK